MIRVLVVEDHWVWADAVVHQIAAMPQAECVGVAAGAEEAIAAAARTAPHVALVDRLLGQDSGLRVARVLRGRLPAMRIVIVTVEPSPHAIAEAREAGLAGFVSKDDLLSGEQVRQLIVEVAGGGTVFSPAVRRIEDPDAADAAFGLTSQEREIIRCLARGRGTPEIARVLCLAPQTVRNKTSRIGLKLGVSGRLEIVAKALDERIISRPDARGGEAGPDEPG